MGGIFKVAGQVIIHRRHDDKDRIGTMGTGFQHLMCIDHEILAQHRQVVAARAATM